MTFKETLQKAKEADIMTWQLLVADEVNVQFPDYQDFEFELICDIVYDWIISNDIDIPVNKLCSLIKDCLESKLLTIEDIKNNIEKVYNEIDRQLYILHIL